MTTTAKIASKGTKGTGITEQLATTLHDNLGKTIVAIIELRSESRGENLKGDETVNLAIQTLEVIPEDVGAAEHVRELAKVAHYNRKLAEDGPKLPVPGDDIEPKVADILAEGKKHEPHAFDGVPTAEDPDLQICDVCGLDNDAAVHQVLTDDDPDDSEDPDAEPDAHEPAEASTIGSPFATTDA